MTPKEKAESLVNDFLDKIYENGSLSFKRILYPKAKECALICVDEILEATKKRKPKIKPNTIDFYWEYNEYYLEVKNEIEKL